MLNILQKKIVENKLSVRQSESLVKALKNKRNLKLVKNQDTNISDLEAKLEEKIGLSVKIHNKKNNSGKILFEYKNLDQLDRIIAVIKNNY